MTEVGLATLNPPSGEIRQGSIGTPIGGFRIEREDGEPIEAETVGRIWIETRSRMSGYWDAPEATAEVVVDGWLDSGDLARADSDGYLWFFGRKKQVIVHDGSNISPYEVESALVDRPAIALAGAVGVHDTVHGENVRAYVTLAEDRDKPSAADLIVHCRERQDRPRGSEADGGGPPPPARTRLSSLRTGFDRLLEGLRSEFVGVADSS